MELKVLQLYMSTPIIILFFNYQSRCVRSLETEHKKVAKDPDFILILPIKILINALELAAYYWVCAA